MIVKIKPVPAKVNVSRQNGEWNQQQQEDRMVRVIVQI
jgi:hypothetical protein